MIKEKKRRASGSKKLAWGKLNRGSGKRSPRIMKKLIALRQERRKTSNNLRPFRARSICLIFLGQRLPLPRLSLPQANFLLPLARRFFSFFNYSSPSVIYFLFFDLVSLSPLCLSGLSLPPLRHTLGFTTLHFFNYFNDQLQNTQFLLDIFLNKCKMNTNEWFF